MLDLIAGDPAIPDYTPILDTEVLALFDGRTYHSFEPLLAQLVVLLRREAAESENEDAKAEADAAYTRRAEADAAHTRRMARIASMAGPVSLRPEQDA